MRGTSAYGFLVFVIMALIAAVPGSVCAQGSYNFLHAWSFGYTYARGQLSASTVPFPPAGFNFPANGVAVSGSYLRYGSFFPDKNGFNGFDGYFIIKVHRLIGISLDGSGVYGSSRTPTVRCTLDHGGNVVCSANAANTTGAIYTALSGPRFAISLGKFTPFAEALLGVAIAIDRTSADSNLGCKDTFRVCRTETSVAYAAGLGVAYRFVRAIDWRVQADWLQTRFAVKDILGASQGHMLGNSWRVATGPRSASG